MGKDSTVTISDLAERARTLLAPWFRERRFPKGDLLWREGETSGWLVAMRSGHVKVYRLLPTGRAVTIFVLGPDKIFGFLPFLDGEPYPAYAQALDDVVADVMVRADLLKAFRSNPDVALTLMSILGKRLREAFDRIENQSAPGVLSRVASAIHALAPYDSTSKPNVIVELPVSASEFAAAIGVSAETLSRTVSKLVADGIVHRIGSGKLQILNLDALERATRPADWLKE